jgi:PAS domain S-box-containing protein
VALPRKGVADVSGIGGNGSAVPEKGRTLDPNSSGALTISPSLGDAWVIVELAPDAILVVDEHGHIVLANSAAEAMFGYDRQTLASLGVDALVPDGRRQAHRGQRAAYDASPRSRPMGLDLDMWARRADGTEFPVEISLSPVTFGDGSRVVAIVREETAHRASEKAAREGLVLADEERIAYDLQHRVVECLLAAGLGIQSVLGRVDEDVAKHLVDVAEELDDAIREIRDIVFHAGP